MDSIKDKTVHIVLIPKAGRGDFMAMEKLATLLMRNGARSVTFDVDKEHHRCFQDRFEVIDLRLARTNLSRWITVTRDFDLQISFPRPDECLWIACNGVPTVLIDEYNQLPWEIEPLINTWVSAVILGLPNADPHFDDAVGVSGLLFVDFPKASVKKAENTFICYVHETKNALNFVNILLGKYPDRDLEIHMPGSGLSLQQCIDAGLGEGVEDNDGLFLPERRLRLHLAERDHDAMIRLWESSEPLCLCTGDQSLTEAIQFGKQFLYECLDHKRKLAVALLSHYGNIIVNDPDFDIDEVPDVERFKIISETITKKYSALPALLREIFSLKKQLVVDRLGGDIKNIPEGAWVLVDQAIYNNTSDQWDGHVELTLEFDDEDGSSPTSLYYYLLEPKNQASSDDGAPIS